MNETNCDLQFCNHGFAASCIPMTEDGAEWLENNLCGEVIEYGGSLLIEHRYLEDIVIGAREDGLICHG